MGPKQEKIELRKVQPGFLASLGIGEIEPLLMVRERDIEHILKCKENLIVKIYVNVYAHPKPKINRMADLAKNCRLLTDQTQEEEILEKLRVIFDAPGKNKEYRQATAANVVLSLELGLRLNWGDKDTGKTFDEKKEFSTWEKSAAMALWVSEKSKDYIVDKEQPFEIRKSKSRLCSEKVHNLMAAALCIACYAVTSLERNYMLRVLVNPRDGRELEENDKLGDRVTYNGEEYFEQISVTGTEWEVKKARDWIRDLVQNQKVPTHFVGVSIDCAMVQEIVKNMEDSIIARNPQLENGFVLPQQLHLTLFVLRCYEQETIDKAKAVLDRAPLIAEQIFQNNFPSITLRGLNEFRQSLVYIGIDKDIHHHILHQFVSVLCQEFRETLSKHTLLGNDTLEGLPHCTVYRAKGSYKGERKKVPSSDFQDHIHTYFGQQVIDHLELSIIGSKSDKGYAHIHRVGLKFGDFQQNPYMSYNPMDYDISRHYQMQMSPNVYYAEMGEDEEQANYDVFQSPGKLYESTPPTTDFATRGIKKENKSLLPKDIVFIDNGDPSKSTTSLNPSAKPFVPNKLKTKNLLFTVDKISNTLEVPETENQMIR